MATGKAGRYHHGDLRTALVDTAIELIAESGVRAFSMAAASRRLGVAVSAPYAHFADRDELLAAVAARAYELFSSDLIPRLRALTTPADGLAAISRAYVQFAGTRQGLFEVLFGLGLEKQNHPEIEAAKKPVLEILVQYVRDLDNAPNPALAVAVEAVSHGYATMLLDGDFGTGPESVRAAAAQAERATRAVLDGREALARPPSRPPARPGNRRPGATR